MKPRVYIETTIPSYLTAWPSKNPVRSAHQKLTRDWWTDRRQAFDLYVSRYVVDECAAGDPTAAADRLAAIRGLPELPGSAAVDALAAALLRDVPLPPGASGDAFHIATAAVGAADILLTWNCTHIANGVLRGRIEAICRAHGFNPPVICTPVDLMEETDGT